MRGSFIIFLLSIGLLLLSVSAEGANWELITRSKDSNVSVFIDTDSIRHISKRVVRAWTKFIFIKPKPSDSKELVEALAYEEHDCAEIKKHDLQITFKHSDGTSDSMTNPNPAKDWSYITPDTLQSAVHDYLCKQGK